MVLASSRARACRPLRHLQARAAGAGPQCAGAAVIGWRRRTSAHQVLGAGRIALQRGAGRHADGPHGTADAPDDRPDRGTDVPAQPVAGADPRACRPGPRAVAGRRPQRPRHRRSTPPANAPRPTAAADPIGDAIGSGARRSARLLDAGGPRHAAATARPVCRRPPTVSRSISATLAAPAATPSPATGALGNSAATMTTAYDLVLKGDYDVAEKRVPRLPRQLSRRPAGAGRAVLDRREPLPAQRLPRRGRCVPDRLPATIRRAARRPTCC